MHFGWMESYAWDRARTRVSWGHTTQIRMDRVREREPQEVGGRVRRQGRTATNRGLILEDRGLPHLVISHTCSEMGSDHPWRKAWAQRNTGKEERYTKTEREEHNILDRLEPTWRKKRKMVVLIFQWKKKCLFDHWIIQKKRQSRKFPKPFSGNRQLQRKVLETSTRAHTRTHQRCGHRSSKNPKMKDSETRTPNTTAYEAVLHCQRLCQLKSTNNDQKYTSYTHDVISVQVKTAHCWRKKIHWWTGKCISNLKKHLRWLVTINQTSSVQ